MKIEKTYYLHLSILANGHYGRVFKRLGYDPVVLYPVHFDSDGNVVNKHDLAVIIALFHNQFDLSTCLVKINEGAETNELTACEVYNGLRSNDTIFEDAAYKFVTVPNNQDTGFTDVSIRIESIDPNEEHRNIHNMMSSRYHEDKIVRIYLPEALKRKIYDFKKETEWKGINEQYLKRLKTDIDTYFK